MALHMKTTQNISKNDHTAQSNDDLPIWSGKDVEQITQGAITNAFLKTDRGQAKADGISPQIPYLKRGYRSVFYAPRDIYSYLDSLRIE